jgi:hypothetical protein
MRSLWAILAVCAVLATYATLIPTAAVSQTSGGDALSGLPAARPIDAFVKGSGTAAADGQACWPWPPKPPPKPVPEPGTMALMGVGAATLIGRMLAKRKQTKA